MLNDAGQAVGKLYIPTACCHTELLPAWSIRLTAEEGKNLNAASGVAYMKIGAILVSLAAPNPAPETDHVVKRRAQMHALRKI
jgi:hypothetical protein